ncbi:MAG: cyclic nucleotide-binding domain-containing protein [Candidatus Hydrogenedentota bacterium]
MPMTQAQLQSLVKRVDLFHGLTTADVDKILSHGITQNFKKNEVIFYKGTVGSQMYIVLGGKVGVFDDRKNLIAELRTGDMFGEMALVTHEPRSANVAATEDGYLFVLTENTFQKLLTKKVAIRILLNMVTVLSRRLKEANLRASG